METFDEYRRRRDELDESFIGRKLGALGRGIASTLGMNRQKTDTTPDYLKTAQQGLATTPDLPKFTNAWKQLVAMVPPLAKFSLEDDATEGTALRTWMLNNPDFKNPEYVRNLANVLQNGVSAGRMMPRDKMPEPFIQNLEKMQRFEKILNQFNSRKPVNIPARPTPAPEPEPESVPASAARGPLQPKRVRNKVTDEPVRAGEADLNKSRIELAVSRGLSQRQGDSEILATLAGMGLKPGAAKSWLRKGKINKGIILGPEN